MSEASSVVCVTKPRILVQYSRLAAHHHREDRSRESVGEMSGVVRLKHQVNWLQPGEMPMSQGSDRTRTIYGALRSTTPSFHY